MGERVYAWSPSPGPQHALIHCPYDEIFYGGARGGGKTDGMLGKFAIKAKRYGKDCIGVFFRKSREDLKEAIERSRQIYGQLGAEFTQKGWWIFPSGARLKFEYLARDADAQNYQGHSYTDLFFEELTNWADPAPINKLRATLRSGAGVPCQFHATGNPGGPGHNWVKERYITPAPLGWQPIVEKFENPFTGEIVEQTRIFIPSKLSDNPFLMADPTYVAKLQQSGSAELVKAWLEGDWDAVEGAYFDCWSADMIIKPFAIPDHWTKLRSFDWGSAAPFSVGWWAIASEDFIGPQGRIPQNAMVRYREWYGASGANVGLKLTVEQVADGIVERESKDRKIGSFGAVHDAVADPSIFATDGGPSLAERLYKGKVQFRKADNKRTPSAGHAGGWDQMRRRMQGDSERPMIFTFDTCRDSIRTIPVLQHDEKKPEDLDTDGEDHAADEWRYACMARPYTRPTPKPDPGPMKLKTMTFNELLKRNRKSSD